MVGELDKQSMVSRVFGAFINKGVMPCISVFSIVSALQTSKVPQNPDLIRNVVSDYQNIINPFTLNLKFPLPEIRHHTV